MGINLFGFTISIAQKPTKDDKKKKSFVAQTENDGAVVFENGTASIHYTGDFEVTWKNDADLINQYRKASFHAELESAIDDIVNEAIAFEPENPPVEIFLDNIDNISDSIKEKIRTEFDTILRLLNFNEEGDEIFRRWYIDGKQYYHILIDESHPKEGIQDIRYIDPRWIKKIREINKKIDDNGVEIIDSVNEYYVYYPKDKKHIGTTQKLKIDPMQIVYTHSGLFEPDKNVVLSYLHQALKPFNQLKAIEDSVVIYRITRAPERRVFYVDVGNLPKTTAEKYLNDIINKYKNKIVYDINTGSVKDSVAQRTMLEDIWLPRREGSRGTEVSLLEGGQNLGELDDVIYFRKKLYKSLHIPMSRLEQESGFSLGRSSEITRDEVKFSKFVEKLRKKFVRLFYKLLKVQLVLKNIITLDDWVLIKENLMFTFNRDSYFVELKELEILGDRIEMLGNLDDYTGKYFSVEWVKKNILQQSEEDIAVEQKQMDKEEEDGIEKGDEDEFGDEEKPEVKDDEEEDKEEEPEEEEGEPEEEEPEEDKEEDK